MSTGGEPLPAPNESPPMTDTTSVTDESATDTDTRRFVVTFSFGRHSPDWKTVTPAATRDDAIRNARDEYRETMPNPNPPRRVYAYSPKRTS